MYACIYALVYHTYSCAFDELSFDGLQLTLAWAGPGWDDGLPWHEARMQASDRMSAQYSTTDALGVSRLGVL